MELIDIGCNLTHDSFDKDREAVIERAHEAGVVQMVVTGAQRGWQPGSAGTGKRKHPGMSCFQPPACIHTGPADFDDDTERLLRELSQQPGVVAVGETGLDYFRDFSPTRHSA